MNNLGRVLKQIRIFSYFNQEQLGNQIGLSISYISQIEKGVKIPSTKVLNKYAEAFDIPLAAIMLFAENYQNKEGLKNKVKGFATKNTLSFLEWISKD